MIPVTEEQRREIEALLRQRDLSPRPRERLEMIKARGLGHDIGMIARWSGRPPRPVRWLARFAVGGPPALRAAPRSGSPLEADPYLHALDAAVAGAPATLGLPYGVRTSARLSASLAPETGVRLTPGWLRTALQRQGDVYGRPKHTLTHLQDAAATAACATALTAAERPVAAAPARSELHDQDETAGETNPDLSKVWQRRGGQPTVPAVGGNRRLTVFGSGEAVGRGRGEVLCPAPDSACFGLYLAALETRHAAPGKEVYRVLAQGPCHTSKRTMTALVERHVWSHGLGLAPSSPQLNPKEREWTMLKRDACSHPI